MRGNLRLRLITKDSSLEERITKERIARKEEPIPLLCLNQDDSDGINCYSNPLFVLLKPKYSIAKKGEWYELKGILLDAGFIERSRSGKRTLNMIETDECKVSAHFKKELREVAQRGIKNIGLAQGTLSLVFVATECYAGKDAIERTKAHMRENSYPFLV
jgi:hypothetical protein